MKRIITIIFSVLLAMTALAQRELGLDEITKSIGGYNWKRKIHEKGTYVIFRHTILCDRSFRNMKGITDLNNNRIAQGRDTLNADTLKAKIDHEEMVYKETFARVRQMLDSLMEASEESYHFENHNRGVDSINYSICLESNKSRKINKDDWDFPDTTETITLNMRSKDTEIGKRVYFRIQHERIEYADCAKETDFDFEAYANAILPVLNREGVKSEDYNPHDDDKKDSLTGKGNGRKKSYIARHGKVFLIPLKDEELAKKIMDEVNKVTKDYLAHNGNQIYDYNYKAYEEAKKKLRTKRPESALFRPILKGLSQNGWKRGLDFSITEDGYFFTIPPTGYNSIRIAPMENSILSSFIKGKRKDVKEEKK
jgi:hypothetical protein